MAKRSDQGARDRLPQFHLVNAQFVTGQLAVGGDLSPRFVRARRQLQELRSLGITHVADLRIEFTDEDLVHLYAPEMPYFWHPLDDAGQRIPEDWFETLVTWALAALASPDAKLLVHCHMGINRAPSAVFAILLAQGWQVADALTAIRTARPVAAIDYADDVLRWHLSRTEASAEQRDIAHRALRDWRRAHQLDVQEVIRLTRSREEALHAWIAPVSGESAVLMLGEFGRDPDQMVLHRIAEIPEELARGDVVFLWRTDPSQAEGIFGVSRVVGPPLNSLGSTAEQPDLAPGEYLPLIVLLLGLSIRPSDLAEADVPVSALLAGEPLPGLVQLSRAHLRVLDRLLGPPLAADDL